MRGQREDYDRWPAAGNKGWGWDDVLPYFMKSEDNSRGASATHGVGGPVSCSDIPGKHELIEAVIKGATELGIPCPDDFNGGDQEGAGYYQLFTKNGLRSRSATGYLKPIRNRTNLDVQTDAHCTRVVFEGTRATGVRYRQGGFERQADCRGEVILAAGAIQSPQLLQLSGVGPGALLRCSRTTCRQSMTSDARLPQSSSRASSH